MTFFTHCALRGYFVLGRAATFLKQERAKTGGVIHAELFFVSFIFSLKIIAL